LQDVASENVHCHNDGNVVSKCNQQMEVD
jgi:hypothetical protein